MNLKKTLSAAGICVVAGLVACATIGAAAPSGGATIGSSLETAANGSICNFQSLEPETRVCVVDQNELQLEHSAADGLVAPFDGIVTSWSVVSGLAPPGTGMIRLALLAQGEDSRLEKGQEVELPTNSPGTRHAFPERLPISTNGQIYLKISISNRNTQEAGAPIGFHQADVGSIHRWSGEPWNSPGTIEKDVELLLNAEIEPDEDGDGFGDLTQDCFPSHPGDQHLCGQDFIQPTIRPQVAVRQGFLRSGVIRVRVVSSEAGFARADGQLKVQGRGGRTFALRNARRKPITPGNQVLLTLRVRKPALKAARAAAREDRKAVGKIRISVTDAAGNQRQAIVRVRPS